VKNQNKKCKRDFKHTKSTDKRLLNAFSRFSRGQQKFRLGKN